jgi:uncharacterized membrane protein YuzA (DUF378 family)
MPGQEAPLRGTTHGTRGRKHILNTADWTALVLLIIGGINWGLVGAFSLDLIASLFGGMTVTSRIAYVLVGLSAIYLTVSFGKLAKKSAEAPREQGT